MNARIGRTARGAAENAESDMRKAEALMELGHGYQRSMVLFSALKIGVFRGIGEKARDASGLARRVGADPGKLSVLLDALVGTGLLVKTPRGYRNSETAGKFLLPGPKSLESILLHHLDCWRDWSRLVATIRAGREPRFGAKGNFQENFIRGMNEIARDRAADVARRFPLRSGERLLDLGGGPGTYALAWANACPGAEVTVFDLPETLRIARKILKEEGGGSRIRLAAGDFLKDRFGGPYDFIWISQILHAFSEADCGKLLRRARAALAPGGRAAVQEFLLAEGKTSPPGPVFFSLHMVAVTEGGRAYTAREISGMMRAAGFGGVSLLPPDARGVGILVGTR
jgi:ubiquinone/menaquinone biosynthesis C-methylase UbiE